VGIGVIIFIGLGTDRAIPGWATYSMGILTVLFWMVLMMMFVLVFVVLGDRNTLSFLPKRDYSLFINEVRPHIGGPG
jgi:polyisoprenyl-phosphate glycosyltransferase